MNKPAATLVLPVVALFTAWITALVLARLIPSQVFSFPSALAAFCLLVFLVSLIVAFLIGFWRWGWSARLYAAAISLLATVLVPVMNMLLANLISGGRS